MKLIKKINPKHLFRSNKSRKSLSRSDPSSFSSASTDSGGSPTTVLPATPRDWKITRAQLESVLVRVGPDPLTREEVELMLSEIDADGDGCISLEDFGAIGSAGDELREAFEFFDVDRDGKITAEELLEVFVALGDEGCDLEECRRMVSEVGRSGDGFVCFEDFARMMELQR